MHFNYKFLQFSAACVILVVDVVKVISGHVSKFVVAFVCYFRNLGYLSCHVLVVVDEVRASEGS